jgi:pilus assembly protein Flp/PilA
MLLSEKRKLLSVPNFLKNDNGASAIEYGLLVALIGVVIAIAVMVLGDTLRHVFRHIAFELW